ncbi:MAG TPA: HAMP domain-containing sensor histidine kinase [Burkholderiales bacterium]|nr:HAMP domain-containing sensor histidine kinase [Burkholderiales bacterium]
MIRLDLRLRIAATIGAVCIGTVTALGIALYLAAEKLESALVEQLMAEQLAFLTDHQRANPGYLPPAGPNVQYYAVRTAADEMRLPRFLHGLGPGRYEIDIGQDTGDRHIAVRQVTDTRLIVVYDVGPHELRERKFKQLIALSLSTVAGVALLLGYWLAGILTRQLTDLARHVGTLVPNGPHGPLASAEQDREVAALAQALDQYQARISNLIRREQEFTANASHELRTPLTAIRTSCELVAKNPALPEQERQRVRNISRAAEHMSEHLRALLFLAREEEPADDGPAAIFECVNDAGASLRGEIARKGLAFEVEVPPEAVVEANRQALHLVLSNLLRNAVRHTQRGFVRVSYAPHRLRVSDSGAGIPADELPRIFERNYRGGDSPEGLGIGLDIVKRICDRAGWTIEVESIPSRGSAFIITFAGARSR